MKFKKAQLVVSKDESEFIRELETYGWYAPAAIDVVIVDQTLPFIHEIPSPPPVPSVPAKSPSTAPIGKEIEGVKVTHYGYPGDSSPDSGSMAGLGDRDNKLVPNLSAALTKSMRHKLFGIEHPSTGKEFDFAGCHFRDDDTAPESDLRIDVNDPYYTGRDTGCTDEMYAKSKAEMVKAGILS